MIVQPGATSVFAELIAEDTTGAAMLLAYNTAGLVAQYRRSDGDWTNITLASMGLTDAWTSGGLAGTTQGGVKLAVPDAAFSYLYQFGVPINVARYVVIRLYGATSMKPVHLRIDLLGIPNRKIGDAGGLPSLSYSGATEGVVQAESVALRTNEVTAIVAAILDILKADVAALPTTKYFRFEYDKLSKIGTAAGTVQAPVGTDSEGASVLYLTIRDDYTDENGQPIPVDLPEGWPDITDVPLTDIHLGFGPLYGDPTVELTASEIVTSGVDVTQSVKFEPREATSAELPPGDDWGTTLLVDYGPGNRRSTNFGLHVNRSWVE